MTRCMTSALVLLGALACDSNQPFSVDDRGASWTTQAEFEIGTRVGGDATSSFGPISEVRILARGERILVAEGAVARATVWTPDGSLVADVGGHGEGPGQFSGMFLVRSRAYDFHVIDGQRFTAFATDGTLVGTTRLPPPSLSFRGFRLLPMLLLDDESVLAVPRIPAHAVTGRFGDDPITAIPILRLSEGADAWRVDTVASLDIRNQYLAMESQDTELYTMQAYGDYDLTYFDPVAGSVVIVRRSSGNGLVRLVEVQANGDTVWDRSLALPPARPGPEKTEAMVDALVKAILPDSPMDRSDPGRRRRVRQQLQGAVYVPDPLPGAWLVRGTASGEIWIRSFEESDSLAAWYAVVRGDDESAARKILLPVSFDVTDATDTHVWGIHRDQLNVSYVQGRRLVPPPDRG